MTELFQKLLAKRRLQVDFLEPRYEDLEDPYLLEDMDLAVERIVQAGKKKEKVLIYGDYDVDGVTASVVMREVLIRAGVRKIEILLPDRFVDGYGMNMGAVDKIQKSGASLVVTVDCGSNSGEVVTKLKQEGIDCIVTDHHEVLDLAEDAIAVVNPKRGKIGRDLAGVGVAFKLAMALGARKDLAEGVKGQEKWLLDLVAIGTICDAMPLLGENRILVSFGMLVLSKTRRLGLWELMKLAGVNKESLNSQSIGFQLGPRLNASGRMDTARTALDLLLAENRAEAYSLAKKLEDLNTERRKTQKLAVKEAEEQVVESDSVIVVEGDWHEGVIGIVAGRLSERRKKPSFVLSRIDNGLLKGSGRSFGDFNLADCIIECKKILVTGGGHNYACGVKIARNKFTEFRRQVNAYYDSLNLKDQDKYLQREVDLELEDLSELSLEFWEDLIKLEPFGEANLEPVFRLKGLAVTNVRKMGDEGQHLKLEVEDRNGKTMSLVAFYAKETWLGVALSDRIVANVSLMLNEWRGVKTVEGRILAIEQDENI